MDERERNEVLRELKGLHERVDMVEFRALFVSCALFSMIIGVFVFLARYI